MQGGCLHPPTCDSKGLVGASTHPTKMRIAQVVGTVTLNRQHPSLTGGSFRLAVPLSLDNLLEKAEPSAAEIVVFDQWGAGIGQKIAISEGAEAAMPFRPNLKPIDTYNSAILDTLNVEALEDESAQA